MGLMRNAAAAPLAKVLSALGLAHIRKSELRRLQAANEALEAIVNSRPYREELAETRCEGIVFSKDRPIQLHALLSSYYTLVSNPAPLHILYRASEQRYLAAYRELAAMFSGRTVMFHEETSFRDDARRLLASVTAPKVFFLVDDIVFIAPVDMRDFASYDPWFFVPSLRMGKQLTFCYAFQQQQPLPGFEAVSGSQDKLAWRWTNGQFDWSYPLSVDGHLFSTREMRAVVDAIEFQGPNSLESEMQAFNGIFKNRLGLCYTTSRIMNVPLNKVQTEYNNRSGDVSADYLLEQWNKGMQIDHRALAGWTNASVHEVVAIHFIPRQ